MPSIKSALTRALALFGLAPAGSVRSLFERAEKAEARAGEFKSQVVELRSETQRHKARAEELQQQLKSALADVERHRARASEVTSAIEKWRAKGEQIRGKVAGTAQTVQVAQEHLMATETKLDLLEAAINLLDRRTRTDVPVPPPAPSEAGQES